MPFSKAKTTIEMMPVTRTELQDLSKKTDTYDDIINDMILLAKKYPNEFTKIQESRRAKERNK